MDWILYIMSMSVIFSTFCLGYLVKQHKEKHVNRVHFYVEMNGRDKELKLYIQIIHGLKLMIAGQSEFKLFGLNPQDFDFIEEYKPVEVFLNMED